MFFDPLWLVFALPSMLLALYAQQRVRGAFNEMSRVVNMRGLTGYHAARLLLDSAGLTHVRIEEVPGELSDHYDPSDRTLRLSPPVGRVPSVAAVGIAAHEVGHAIQHHFGYAPLRLRSALVGPVSFAANIAPILFIVGLLVQFAGLIWLGVVFYALAVVFALVTMPVELDASRRAMQLLQANGLVTTVEYDGAKKVLDAAALTYLAGLLQAVGQLLYFVLIATGVSRRDE